MKLPDHPRVLQLMSVLYVASFYGMSVDQYLIDVSEAYQWSRLGYIAVNTDTKLAISIATCRHRVYSTGLGGDMKAI